MGEARRDALRVGFDRAIKLEFHGAKVSSDAGFCPYRDLDEAAQLPDSGAAELFDFRTGTNVQHGMTALLRQSVYSRLAGYEDVNDAERLSVDPVMCHVVGGRAVDRTAASTSQVGRFETEVLTHPENLAALMAMPGQWVDRIRQRRPMKKLILDMDSSVSETYGQQEGSMYNGHFACECYHPLFIFNHDGDVERALLRNGNVASADDWRSALEPVFERYRDVDVPKCFRGDAAFAIPELYDLLEADGYEYVIRLKANQVLERHMGHVLTRPASRPPKRPHRFYHSFDYQAKSWNHARHVVAKVEWHQGELFPRVGFIATNLGGGAKRRSNGQRLPRISMMTTVAQRLSFRYVPMVAVAGAIFFSGINFREHLPRRVPVALAVGGLVLGVVVCGFWFRAALRVRTDACPHCQYRFVPGELRPSRCAECGKPTTVN